MIEYKGGMQDDKFKEEPDFPMAPYAKVGQEEILKMFNDLNSEDKKAWKLCLEMEEKDGV